jgi:hypothetical protein
MSENAYQAQHQPALPNPDIPVHKALLYQVGETSKRAPWVFKFNWAGVYTLQQMTDAQDPIQKLIDDIKACVGGYEPEVIWNWAWAFSYAQRQTQYANLQYKDFIALLPVGDEFMTFAGDMLAGVLKIMPTPKKKLEPEQTTSIDPNLVGQSELTLQHIP